MSAKSINVALIGSKFMGRAHSNAYITAPKFFDLPLHPVMHTVVGRNAKELEAFARRWGWERCSTDWKAVVRDPEIGLVDIGVPNDTHREMAIGALEAGKHVACEKPLADTLDNARAMVQAAKKAKKSKTMVWFNYRRCPAVSLARQIVREGRLGRIFHMRFFYLQDWAGPDTPLLWRFQGKVAGSGSLGDLCAHSIDTARFVTGDEFVQIIGATMETFVKERALLAGGSGGEISGTGAAKAAKKGKSTVDDATLFLARTRGGALASFEATRLSTGNKNGNRFEIHGENGALRFNFERMPELEWYDATLPKHLQGWSTINVSDGAAGHPYAHAWWPVAHAIGYEHSFINQVADMMGLLAGKEIIAPLPDFNEAYQTQRIMEAVTLSAKNRCPVDLSEVK
ncbi:MAG: Gfo/Idh/MocA family oxidoreductase [Phycisphaeraceae bacterium]|nr:Gfo/Idh/MocA family oxidoreductase [Phycisphaeraceae bacterium]